MKCLLKLNEKKNEMLMKCYYQEISFTSKIRSKSNLAFNVKETCTIES